MCKESNEIVVVFTHLHSTLAHVEEEEARGRDTNHSDILPICGEAILLSSVAGLVDAVLTGKDEPKDHQSGVEETLQEQCSPETP